MKYHDLLKTTVTKLREEAAKYPDISGVTAMQKEQLVEALARKMGIEIPKKKTASIRNKSDLKRKIQELRAKRLEARAQNDRKQVKLLRRRIHSLKRLLRGHASPSSE